MWRRVHESMPCESCDGNLQGDPFQRKKEKEEKEKEGEKGKEKKKLKKLKLKDLTASLLSSFLLSI